jgi:hypothetical protein
MHVLVIDVGGTNVKVLCHGPKATRKFPSGPELTPEGMVEKVKATTKDWNYDVVSIGYPGQWIQEAPQFGQLLQRSDIVSQRDRFEDEDFDRTPKNHPANDLKPVFQRLTKEIQNYLCHLAAKQRGQ